MLSGQLVMMWPTPHGFSKVGKSNGPSGNELGRAVNQSLYPTSTAGEHTQNKSAYPGAPVRPTLVGMARKGLWPTPTVNGNHNVAGMSEKSGDGLATAVKKEMWPTPTASVGGPEPEGKTGRKLVTAVAMEMFPTPQARDHFPAHSPEYIAAKKAEGHGMSNLNDSVGGALNPTWVEWLMGWPLGWTDLSASATDKFRTWCCWHRISFPPTDH